MNQILYTSNGKPSGPLPIKSIVKFFAIALIVLGVIFFGEASYSLFSVNTGNGADLDTSVPQIAFTRNDNIASVSVTHNKGITWVKYYWNDEDATIEKTDSKREFLLDNLNIPSGTNTLHVEALDDNGRSSSAYYEYSYDGIAIDLSVVNNSDMKIVASDVNGMSHMTYRWNSGEEITVYPNSEGDISIEKTSEIPSGLNTLYITAVNSNNITLSKKQEIKGNKRPEISFYIKGTDLYIDVTDEEGVDNVSFQVNADEPEILQANGEKHFSYRYYVGDERILVTIIATDIDGVSKTVKAKNY